MEIILLIITIVLLVALFLSVNGLRLRLCSIESKVDEYINGEIEDRHVLAQYRDDMNANTLRFLQTAEKFTKDMAVARVGLSAIGKRIHDAQNATTSAQ